MTTLYFQGKWAIKDSENNKYLSGDSNIIAATSSTITPSATFILYSQDPGPSVPSDNLFIGYFQLQGNMQYVNVAFRVGGINRVVAGAPDLAELNGSNLSNLDLTQAQLMGANLSGSYLFNAHFNGANLRSQVRGAD